MAAESHYAQLVLRRVSDERAQRGSDPVFGLDLLPYEQVVGVERYWTVDQLSRSTVDHHATVWVVVDLGTPDATSSG